MANVVLSNSYLLIHPIFLCFINYKISNIYTVISILQHTLILTIQENLSPPGTEEM